MITPNQMNFLWRPNRTYTKITFCFLKLPLRYWYIIIIGWTTHSSIRSWYSWQSPNENTLSSKYCICLTSDSRGRILWALALVPLSNGSTKGLACVAWRFSNFLSNLSASAQSDKTAKTSRSPPGSSWLRRIWRSLSRLRRFLSVRIKSWTVIQKTHNCF